MSFTQDKIKELKENFRFLYLVEDNNGGNAFMKVSDFLTTALDQQKEMIVREIENSPTTFGLLDSKGRGGAILIDDCINLIKKI